MIYIVIPFLRFTKKNNFKYGNRDTYYRIVYNSAKNWKP